MVHSAALADLLALEYNCAPADFYKQESILTLSALQEGRRMYNDAPNFFHMCTLGGNAVITANEALHPFLKGFMAGRPGHWLFELPNLVSLMEELGRFGYGLTGTYHMFLHHRDVLPQKDYPVKWFYDKEIYPFYADGCFPNAIMDRPRAERPDMMTVCAYDGDVIMGMAGCSLDAPHWLQIGIDVMPEYRSMGVGTYLVTLLKNRILEMGEIPFYGTSVSNYHSWNVAYQSGFRPAWVEIGARKLNE